MDHGLSFFDTSGHWRTIFWNSEATPSDASQTGSLLFSKENHRNFGHDVALGVKCLA